jgi:hypothetical protein
MRVESLDGDRLSKTCPSDQATEMHGGHPAGSNDAVKLVPIDPHRLRAFKRGHFR